MADTKKKAPARKPELPTIPFKDTAAFAAWLTDNHGSSPGLWLKLGKKDSGIASITYPEALLVALAWGWIDGQKRSVDSSYWVQKFTPRGPKSIWSKANCAHVERLTAAGEMKASGLAEVERAKADGRWDAAYDGQRTATVPPDLAQALEANPKAAAFFKTLESNNRYAILFRIHHVKKAETRARKIAHFVGMLERGEKVHP